jgi:hypothetical protein
MSDIIEPQRKSAYLNVFTLGDCDKAEDVTCRCRDNLSRELRAVRTSFAHFQCQLAGTIHGRNEREAQDLMLRSRGPTLDFGRRPLVTLAWDNAPGT